MSHGLMHMRGGGVGGSHHSCQHIDRTGHGHTETEAQAETQKWATTAIATSVKEGEGSEVQCAQMK